MGTNTLWAVGLCFVLVGTTGEVLRASGSAEQINIPNVNPQIERHFEQLRQREARERMRRQNRADTQKIVDLAAQLKEYGDSAQDGPMPADAVRKAKEVEKLAKRVNTRLRQSAGR